MSQLKNEFFAETGIEWENSQGEPDIDYINWLEAKVKKFTSTNSDMVPCPHFKNERTCPIQFNAICGLNPCLIQRTQHQ